MVKQKQMYNIIFREKPAGILVELLQTKLQRIYPSSLAKTIDCTYSHVVKLLGIMKKRGLVNFEKLGRIKLLSLTPKGRSVAEKIIAIREEL